CSISLDTIDPAPLRQRPRSETPRTPRLFVSYTFRVLKWHPDVLIVTKLDRLARSLRNLLGIIDPLERKGAALRIQNLNLDTNAPTGKLMLNLLGRHRTISTCDQREGIAKAKAAGSPKAGSQQPGRKRLEFWDSTGMRLPPQRLHTGSIGRASFYRVL